MEINTDSPGKSAFISNTYSPDFELGLRDNNEKETKNESLVKNNCIDLIKACGGILCIMVMIGI